jgi:hypothetical protein
VVVQASGRPKLEVGWERTRGSEAVARSRDSYGGGSESDGGRRKGNGVNLDPGNPIYGRGHRIFLLRFLPPYNTPQRLYSEKFTRRLRRIFR